MALTVVPPLFWIVLASIALVLLLLAWRLRLRWLPALPLRFLLLGTILFIVLSPEGTLVKEETPPREVLLIDASDSVAPDALYAVQSHSRLWQAADANRFVVAFGQQAHSVPTADATWPEVDGRASHIGQALTTAQTLLGDRPGRIILASDGAATDEQHALEAVSALEAAGHRLDVIPLNAHYDDADIWVGPLWAPSMLWEGGAFTAVLPVYARQPGTVTVKLTVNDVLRVQQEETLQAGASYVPLVIENPALGILTLKASVESASDPRRENNTTYTTMQVFASPEVLFVSETSLEGTFVAGLRTMGVTVEQVEPAALPADLGALEAYDVVFLDNLLASSLAAEQMLALDLFVSRRGGGSDLPGRLKQLHAWWLQE